MIKKLILVAMVLLQSLFCSTYACDTQIDSQSAQVQFKSSTALTKKTKTLHDQKSHNESKSQNDSSKTECNQCDFCFHLLVTFLNVEFAFISSEKIYSNNFISHSIYHQPFIDLSVKPPIRS